MISPTANDIEVLAKTAYGEDRGDGLSGMIAVCWVVRNRANIAQSTGRDQFGKGSLASACLVPKQFSCWDATSGANVAAMSAATLSDPAYQLAMLAALMVATDQVSDPTQGATGYWADSISTPSWAEGKSYVSIGHQRYAAGV